MDNQSVPKYVCDITDPAEAIRVLISIMPQVVWVCNHKPDLGNPDDRLLAAYALGFRDAIDPHNQEDEEV
jgi:hypothetical protein